MLCLGEQVDSHAVGVGRVVGPHQQLGRSGEHIDGHPACHLLFGGGDKAVSRAHDGIDFGDFAGAIGERSDGLGSSYGEQCVGAGDRCCRQRDGTGLG